METFFGGFGDDCDIVTSKHNKRQAHTSTRVPAIEKEIGSKEINLAKIKVVVRKRPLNKKELSRKEDDIITVSDRSCLIVHEPKQKVDLTAYVEKHEFFFDAVLDENVTNEEVYHATIKPIIPTIFQRRKATCFAYGQTGSGKTFTMQPLPLKAVEEIVTLLNQHFNRKYRLWLSYFEIYGGKLYDLLSDRRKLCMREDGRQHVRIIGLQEFKVSDVKVVKGHIEKGNAARTTGSTGANEESSRSHAILQLAIKQHKVKSGNKKQNDGNESKGGKLIGKISFIDLAGSERGADTTDNDRQTRMEGAEINKSLLALKECIRALDNDHTHIPFRGSKLTEVLRDSFVGNSNTIMISCISPSVGSCEHTLNTLRYADRVKSLSKNSNSKKDQDENHPIKESSSISSFPVSTDAEHPSDQNKEVKVKDMVGQEGDKSLLASTDGLERHCSLPTYYTSKDREESRKNSKNVVSNCLKLYSSISIDTTEDGIVQKMAPSHREEEPEKSNSLMMIEKDCVSDLLNYMQHHMHYSSSKNSSSGQYQQQLQCQDGKEEKALILAHRKEVEETINIVREEMKLLAVIDQPGSLTGDYVTQLSLMLSRKAAVLASLQAQLAQFQHHLNKQEIRSRRMVTN